MTADLYGALDIPPDASTADIRAAYRRKAKATHPDSGGSPEAFAAVCLAHDVLTIPHRRRRYDQTGEAETSAPDNIEAKARTVIMAHLERVIGEVKSKGREPYEFDLIGSMKVGIASEIAKAKDAHASTKTELAKAKKLAKRFRGKGRKESIVAQMMLARIADAERDLPRMTAEVPAQERALALLADETFEWDAPVMNASTTGASWFFTQVGPR